MFSQSILIIGIKISLLYVLALKNGIKEWQGRLQCLTEIWKIHFSSNSGAENQGNPGVCV